MSHPFSTITSILEPEKSKHNSFLAKFVKIASTPVLYSVNMDCRRCRILDHMLHAKFCMDKLLLLQSFNYTPKVEHNGRNLTCRLSTQWPAASVQDSTVIDVQCKSGESALHRHVKCIFIHSISTLLQCLYK